eukprot:TRINITY_DN21404_c0_g1_i1.p1 TRINITY_DN21404_c0_g1~~TRINITY_DN21404_c0_g1_i1.p1  ORF type:complete len:458 (+),score=109.55 TRINITY_DN21404_c0_g1_i1:71-1375(+)
MEIIKERELRKMFHRCSRGNDSCEWGAVDAMLRRELCIPDMQRRKLRKLLDHNRLVVLDVWLRVMHAMTVVKKGHGVHIVLPAASLQENPVYEQRLNEKISAIEEELTALDTKLDTPTTPSDDSLLYHAETGHPFSYTEDRLGVSVSSLCSSLLYHGETGHPFSPQRRDEDAFSDLSLDGDTEVTRGAVAFREKPVSEPFPKRTSSPVPLPRTFEPKPEPSLEPSSVHEATPIHEASPVFYEQPEPAHVARPMPIPMPPVAEEYVQCDDFSVDAPPARDSMSPSIEEVAELPGDSYDWRSYADADVLMNMNASGSASGSAMNASGPAMNASGSALADGSLPRRVSVSPLAPIAATAAPVAAASLTPQQQSSFYSAGTADTSSYISATATNVFTPVPVKRKSVSLPVAQPLHYTLPSHKRVSPPRARQWVVEISG